MSTLDDNDLTKAKTITIPDGWIETELGEVCEIKYGKDHKKLKKGEIPCFGSGGIMRYVERELYNKPSVLIPRKGTLSNLFYVDKPFWTVDTLFYTRINELKITPRYLFNLLKTHKLEDLNVGSAVPSLTTAVLNKVLIKIPKSVEEQISIAKILTSFDDKIILLKNQNQILETLVQTLFKEQFGKYQIGDELPDKWEVLTIDEIVDTIIDYRGKTPKKLGMDWSESGIPALSAKTIKKGKIVRRDAMNFGDKVLYDLWMKDKLQKGDILLTSEAPLGEMYYINDDKKYILSQRLFALRVNDNVTSQYLYHYLFSRYGQHLLKARASGSTVEGIRQSELRKIEVIIPDDDSLEKASSLFQDVFDKKHNNSKQIQSLKETRNELIPKLMSGEIRIKEFIK